MCNLSLLCVICFKMCSVCAVYVLFWFLFYLFFLPGMDWAYMSYISVQKLSQWCKPSFQTETTHWNSSISFGSHFFTRFIHHVYLVLLRPCAKCGIFAFEYHVIKNISYLKIKTYERCMCFSSKVISKTHDFIANYVISMPLL